MSTLPPIATANNDASIVVCDRTRTAELLDFNKLVDSIAQAAAELDAGTILSPERMVVPLGDGGVLLSMPATAPDIGIHKLVNVQPSNVQRQLPTIHGTVTVCDSITGKIICLLDGPELTGRRTAAVTLLAIRTLLKRAPNAILLIGTGAQARYHVQAINALYPQCKVWVRGQDDQASSDFCTSGRQLHEHLEPSVSELPIDVDVVITVTTSTEPVYNEPARPGRLIIGVGAFKPEMAELGKVTLDGSDLFADDPAGARHEAGDFLRAEIDWARVGSLAAALRGEIDTTRPAVFKSVGTAAWDLAAARVALQSLPLAE
ncbi:delta(1)-pyrroline-2-carboxylate reductase family protein [Pseudomonas sp. LPB0260]|uniref:bifunctional Delta(1)-pyrroline-2-carboxylate/Delta(1)-piperideine-2- carboxylate reductase n=1 Tax=Pseudomonas sp. LPB0260 TaxID=2614442 RepID=UPI0015C2565B|nr:bifunctional Delta(1)-pyrroline-2-carboxylate/Delta(1)-piperideine-2-carboxylate reductase [Pseudomonas sp. LPB0260]QLC74693.1 delta(1)-pyrroline-2-carboxylate reductase family protein [Pseudomonas sp. LPB0260]